jgi:WD repeat-containing protein 55
MHEDFVADIHVHGGRHALLTVSGDGTLAHMDLRTQTVIARSDAQEDELLCGACVVMSQLHSTLCFSSLTRSPLPHCAAVTLVKGGRKAVCGSQEGMLSIFDLADIQDISDRFPGHPSSVDALVAVTEDMVLTGSSDGVIRVLSILPNKMLGALEMNVKEDLCLPFR